MQAKIAKRRLYTEILTDRVMQFILTLGYANRPMTASEIARDIEVTYHHFHAFMLPKLKHLGCIEDYKDGKYRMVRLTAKGFQIFKRFAEIGELLGEPFNGSGDRRLDLIILGQDKVIYQL